MRRAMILRLLVETILPVAILPSVAVALNEASGS
jgi:hypothetical protein